MDEKRIHLLKEYIEQDPEDPFNRYALAMEYYEEAPNTALQYLGELVSDQPDYLPTYYKLAHLYWELEMWNDADRVFKQGIKLAEQKSENKTLHELKSAYQNFEFDRE